VFEHSKRRWIVPLVVSLTILLFDQICKHWVLQNLGPEPAVKYKSLIGDWFRLVYSQNTGIAFNFFPDMSPIFIITSLLITALVVYGYVVYLPNHNPFVQVSVGMILGGALGNTLDRIQHGYVIDFIQVGWWPVFNIADSGITTGAIVLALFLILTKTVEQIPLSPQDDALLGELLNRNVDDNRGSTTEVQSPLLGTED